MTAGTDRVSTKAAGTGRARVWLNGEEIGMVFKHRAYGKTDMWRSSLTGRRYYDTRKDAVEATVNAIR